MITSEETVMLMFFTQFADLVKVRRIAAAVSGHLFEVEADGLKLGLVKRVSNGDGWFFMYEEPVPMLPLSAPTREQCIGLALRTANQLCAKAAFQRSPL